MPIARILVVEDENIVNEDIQSTLKSLGYEIAGSAATGEKAVQITAEKKPELVLMDIMLRGDMDGIEAAEQIRSLFNIPVVYLTAYSDENTLQRAKITEPFGYVIKPFEERELHSNISIALHKHKIESELRESKQWFSTVLSSIGDAIIATDANGNVNYTNPVAEVMCGWEGGLALGLPFAEVVQLFVEDEKGNREPLELDSNEMNSAKELAEESILVAKDDSSRPIIGTVAPIKNENGVRVGAVYVLKDITEKRVVERALKASEKFNREIVENSPLAILYLDADATVNFMNPAFARLMNIAPQERDKVINVKIEKVIETSDRKFQHQIKELLKGNSITVDNIDTRTRIGKTKYLTLYGAPRFDAVGEPVGAILMFLDMTDYNELESQFRHAQKMKALGTLSAGIAHDFNNILTLIKGNAELGSMKTEADNPLNLYFDRIQASVIKGTELSKNLLAIGRPILTSKKVVNLNYPLKDTIALLERAIDPRITVELKHDKNIWLVDADLEKIGTVFMNICMNAIDAMPEGGFLKIETGNVKIDAEYCKRVRDSRPGEFVCVKISDTGCGIPADIIERIFEPFFTTKGNGKGNGLGLAMAYSIIKGHEGWITVDSKVDDSTVFSLFFPKAEGIIEKPEEEIEESEPSRGSETILLVDDDEEVRNLGRTILENYGYEVLLARDGEEAVVLFRRERKKIDLVILDLYMPHKSGKEAFDEMLEIDPKVKVIIYSGFNKVSQIQEMLRKGAKKFIQKPYRMKQLLKEVRKILDAE